jgi:hypothetical protein
MNRVVKNRATYLMIMRSMSLLFINLGDNLLHYELGGECNLSLFFSLGLIWLFFRQMFLMCSIELLHYELFYLAFTLI